MLHQRLAGSIESEHWSGGDEGLDVYNLDLRRSWPSCTDLWSAFQASLALFDWESCAKCSIECAALASPYMYIPLRYPASVESISSNEITADHNIRSTMLRLLRYRGRLRGIDTRHVHICGMVLSAYDLQRFLSHFVQNAGR